MLYVEYLEWAFGYDGPVLHGVLAFFSVGLAGLVLFSAWIAFLIGEVPIWASVYAPIIFPLPIHLMHLAAFAWWALNRRD